MKKSFLLILFFLPIHFIYAQEICDNGIDDDGDLAIDLQDSDCECLQSVTGILPENFDNYSSCPSNFSGYLDLITDWRPAGTPQAVNTCDYIGGIPFPIVTLPMPSGEGAAGLSSNEGLVRCLDNCKLIAGETYTISFDGSVGLADNFSNVEFILYGRTNCNNVFSGPADFDFDFVESCFSNFQWTEIISISPTTSIGEWESLSGTFTAGSNYGALMFGFNCQAGIGSYSYIDNLEITGDFAGSGCDIITDFPEVESELSGDCISGNTLTASPDSAVQYQWYLDGVAIPGATDNPWTIDTNIIGQYQVRAIYSNGNCAISPPVILEEADLESLDIDLFSIDPLCYGENTGSIELSVDSPNTPLEIIWSTGDGNQILSDLGAGSYSLTVTDAKGCFGSSSTMLNESDSIEIELVTTDPLCYNENTGSIELNVDSPNTPLEFLWSTGDEDSFLMDLEAGEYSVTVIDANGCLSSSMTTLVQPDPFYIEFLASQPTFSQGGNIEVLTFGGNSPYQYEWNNGLTESLLTDLEQGVYAVAVSDANNCSVNATYEFFDPLMGENILDKIYVPNAFTPNDDGVNDKFDFFFYPQDIVNQVTKMQVFNRWGGLVFETSEQEPNSIQFWDGFINGKRAESGVYIYLIQLELYNQENLTLSGDVTLVR